MHIKRVTIKNFVSYEELNQPQLTLSPGLNLLLGLNGSGKSNFLQGKRTLLNFFSDNLRTEIFKSAGMQSIYGVNIVELVEFGVGQKYNTLFGVFANSSTNSASYVQGAGGSATWGASTQVCVGIDNTRGAYVRPVSVQAESGGTFSVLPDGQFDMYGSRVQKVGFYGFLEEGRVCLDARSTVGILLK